MDRVNNSDKRHDHKDAFVAVKSRQQHLKHTGSTRSRKTLTRPPRGRQKRVNVVHLQDLATLESAFTKNHLPD
ncbi:hypothetical protein BC938DRAFT_478323 [Jimgerdemannia flammicorona]|uniref:Uncharacterized protein n=1 Tax=Jimgerdemannia flammicorona TaxID=994334 RepID=A0A433QN05_9FUNG|nr:hypothetical protein BC938DRAFT_478323 [Jimgerdemannia flammicorona]